MKTRPIRIAALCLSLVAMSAAAQESELPALPDAVPEQPISLSMQQQTALRCSAAFAVVWQGQQNGDEAALAYPAMGTRGREYMVLSIARLMDEKSLDRVDVSRLLSAEVRSLWADEASLSQTMPPCLTMLEVSGL